MIVGFLVGCVIGALWGGYVISVLWGWFLVPKFGFPAINWAIGAAINLIVQVVVVFVVYSSKLEESNWRDYVLMQVVVPSVALVFGYILKGFVT